MLLHMAETSAYVPRDLIYTMSFCNKSNSEGIIFRIFFLFFQSPTSLEEVGVLALPS